MEGDVEQVSDPWLDATGLGNSPYSRTIRSHGVLGSIALSPLLPASGTELGTGLVVPSTMPTPPALMMSFRHVALKDGAGKSY